MKSAVNKKRLQMTCFCLLILSVACTSPGSKKTSSSEKENNEFTIGTYGYDVGFLAKNNIRTIELKDEESNACVLISPAYQGRVMTSSFDGNEGNSFGWINYELISSGEIKEHFNPIGGEERFWVGPEGGPFSVYFAQGKEQVFDNWFVPQEIDTEPFDVISQSENKVRFNKSFQLINALDERMHVGVSREVSLLSLTEVEMQLGISFSESLKCVAYESRNMMTNEGEKNWSEQSGVLSIWMLCMFNPSMEGVVVIPFNESTSGNQTEIVKDDYFGKVPEDRLKVTDGTILFKVDGKLRSKIGISPQRATPYCGSYDSKNKILTLLWYSKPEEPGRYVNSKWGIESELLDGDIINSYNDGPIEDGSIMGPFYEIESSSPALFLEAGHSFTHKQRIYHIAGNDEELNAIANNILKVSLADIKNAF